MVSKVKNSTLEATIAVSNVGSGMELLVNEGSVQQSVIAKSVKAGNNVSITDDGSSLTINALNNTGGVSGGIVDVVNLGSGAGVVAGVSGTTLLLKSIQAGSGVTIDTTANEITINATAGGGGEANTASNAGTGVGIFKAKTGVDLALKSLVAGPNITLAAGANDITISATAGVGTSPVKSLTEFGAVGDGTTDSSAAFIAAMEWIIANKLPVFIPAGHYRTAPFTLYSAAHQDWCGFYGEDPKRTIIQAIGSSSGPLFTCGSPSMTAYAGYLRFANITFQANGTSGSAVHIYDLAWAVFENCSFQGGATGMTCYGGVNILFSGCRWQYSGTGLLITKFARAGGGWPNNIKIIGGIAGSNSVCGINFDYGRQLIMEGVQVEGNGTAAGNTGHGGLIVGSLVGQETGTHGSNAHQGVLVSNGWFEDNRGIADVYLQSGLNTLSDCMFWSQPALVTNNLRVTGQKYILRGCDFAQTFSAGVPNVFESGAVLSGNSIDTCEAPYMTWNNSKTTVTTGAQAYVPTLKVLNNATVRGINLAPVWNSLSGNTINKPVILCGGDASSATPTISFGRTMANNNTVVIVQPIDVQQSSRVYSPLLTGVTTTGFTISKDVISPTTKSVENYAVYWIAIGEEA